MPASQAAVAALQSRIWNGSIPLEIRLAASDCRTYDKSEPYFVQYPRLSYLALLLPRLHANFIPDLINPEVGFHDAWLSFEDVPLKWHLPSGLLYDLFAGAEPFASEVSSKVDVSKSKSEEPVDEATASGNPLPWQLTLHYCDAPEGQLIQLDPDLRAMQDTFINAVKEADYVRNGTARTVMSLSKDDSDNLWLAVQTHNRGMFNVVNNKLLNPPGMELRHIPIKIYLPTSANQDATDTIEEEPRPGQLRVVQSLVPLKQEDKKPQTLGTALNVVLPTIFPSKRVPIYASAVLHGAVVPLSARINDLGKAAAYPDGFLHVALVMHG
ncbi:Autophagy protein 5 [Pseudocercospora fuligena]|uniref:Autophagy protein 5 n=1 Tax=Pseudocercospora fuligena TaxID=685502 RepID=A0A8H6RCQ5_9PEZI|nr:Autophagy protein 5 [Pseudocercospora fuligena]